MSRDMLRWKRVDSDRYGRWIPSAFRRPRELAPFPRSMTWAMSLIECSTPTIFADLRSGIARVGDELLRCRIKLHLAPGARPFSAWETTTVVLPMPMERFRSLVGCRGPA